MKALLILPLLLFNNTAIVTTTGDGHRFTPSRSLEYHEIAPGSIALVFECRAENSQYWAWVFGSNQFGENLLLRPDSFDVLFGTIPTNCTLERETPPDIQETPSVFY